jgi:ribosome-associated toxin RatA of RatAB toxin-antitoxin module
VGVDRAESSIEIGAPVTACFDAVLDFESYPQWQSAVIECRVHERDEQGRGSVVETVADGRVRQVRYILAYTYDPPDRIAWTLVEGDPKSIEGEYAFEPSGGGTLVTYRLAVDLGRYAALIPGDVKRKMTEHLMRTSVEELKTRAESLE